MSAGNEREFIDHLQNKEKGGRPMKCPMLTMYATSFKPPEEFKDRDCLKEECAWWLKENNACAILTLAQGSTYVHKALLNFASKIPSEEKTGGEHDS